MNRTLRLICFGAVFGAVAIAAGMAFTHAIVLKSSDWMERSRYAFVLGGIGGAIGALTTAIASRAK